MAKKPEPPKLSAVTLAMVTFLLLSAILHGQDATPAGDASLEGEWYRADRIGNRFEPIAVSEAAQMEYAIQRLVVDGRRIERLYARGDIVEERRVSGLVEELRVFAGDGSLEYTERLLRHSDGSPREVRRTEGDETRIYRYRRTTGLPFEEWFEHGDKRKVWRFSPEGRVLESISWAGEDRALREVYSYDDAGRLEELRREDFQNGEELIRRYRNRRVVGETLRIADRVVEETSYLYDDEERLIREEIERPDGSEVTSYEYGDEGELQTVAYRRNGQVSLVVRYQDAGRIEDRYRHGSLILRSFFEGDTLVREELYRAGRLIDIRSPQ